MTDAEADAAVGPIEFSTDLDSLSDRQMVVEAVAEKVVVFQALEGCTHGCPNGSA